MSSPPSLYFLSEFFFSFSLNWRRMLEETAPTSVSVKRAEKGNVFRLLILLPLFFFFGGEGDDERPVRFLDSCPVPLLVPGPRADQRAYSLSSPFGFPLFLLPSLEGWKKVEWKVSSMPSSVTSLTPPPFPPPSSGLVEEKGRKGAVHCWAFYNSFFPSSFSFTTAAPARSPSPCVSFLVRRPIHGA